MLDIASVERRAKLMGAMLRQLNIDVTRACTEALGTTMQRVARTCLLCRNVDTCAQWLAAPIDPTGYHLFCPNAETLDRLPREQLGCGQRVRSEQVYGNGC